MDNFLEFLVKKSDLQQNEYFNYKKTRIQQKNYNDSFTYNKILEPVVSDYIVFDFETTGMKPGVNEILEIGAVKILNNSISGVFNTLINPQQFIPYYISNLTHITNDMVEDKESIESVLPKFINFIGDLPLIAHNARFDMSFLMYNANKQNIIINNPVLDTLYLSRKYNKECQKHNLAYLTNYFNVNLNNAHRAYYDALATNQIYQLIKKKYNKLQK